MTDQQQEARWEREAFLEKHLVGGNFTNALSNALDEALAVIASQADAAEALRAENARLRETLTGIVNGNWTADYMRSRAWSALDAAPEGKQE